MAAFRKEIILTACCTLYFFFPSFLNRLFHFIQPAAPCDQMTVQQSSLDKELLLPLVKQETFWLIFSICLAGFELKLDVHQDRTAVTLVSPARPVRRAHTPVPGRRRRKEGGLESGSNFSGLWADSTSAGRAGNHGGNNVYIDQLSGRFMASFCCNGELVGRLSATQHHRLLPMSRPGNLSLPRSGPNTCDSTSTWPNSIKRKCWN